MAPEVILAQATDPGLVDACTSEPGLVCEWVYDLTSNGTLAKGVEWFLAKPAKVILVAVIAWVINRLVRRGIARFIARLIEQREERAREREQAEVHDGRFAQLRDRALAKTEFLSGQAERSKQRAHALGSVLSSEYKSSIEPALANIPDLPAEAIAVAEDSVGGAVTIADKLPPEIGEIVTFAAHNSFMDGWQVMTLVSCGVAIFGAIIVFKFMPSRP